MHLLDFMNFRHKLYDQYKANRSSMPEELENKIPKLYEILNLLGYDSISDFELKNPNILNDYKKIIVLHNEYVSKIMFDA